MRSTLRRNWMRCAASILALSALTAQEPAPLSIKVDVNLVNIAFVARGRDGALARKLTADDIEVFEDGVPQQVKFFSRSENVPLRLGLLVDASESQSKFVKQHRRDFEAFVSASVSPLDRAFLICFGDHVRLVSDFTASAPALMDALEQYEKGKRSAFPELEPDNTREGGTALFDAAYGAARKLAIEGTARKALILFSDGEDNSSAHDLMDAIEAAQSADTLIYTVRYTAPHHGGFTARNHYGIREMNRLANETGAVSFDASEKSTGELLNQVAEELKAMYEVGYITSQRTRDGSFRKVVIRAKDSSLTIRSKPGYHAR